MIVACGGADRGDAHLAARAVAVDEEMPARCGSVCGNVTALLTKPL